MSQHEVPVPCVNTSRADYGGATTINEHALPLNSKRLTACNLKCIARALDVPTTSSAAEVRTLLDGKLTELGKEPRNTQVKLHESGMIELLEEGGVFLQIAEDIDFPVLPTSSEESDGDSSGDTGEIAYLKKALCDAKNSRDTLQGEVTALTAEVEKLSRRCKELWSLNCTQLAEFDEILSVKDEELAALCQQGRNSTAAAAHTTYPGLPGPVHLCKGKAPPVDPFSGDDPSLQFEDWLPGLKRAADWYAWTEEEHLLQLAGHLRSQALQEWNLLDSSDKASLASAVKSLKARLDPGNKLVAAQDFRHLSQAEGEPVSKFISRLESLFKVAYGKDNMGSDTREVLLYGQLQEGLRYEIIKSPVVSGARSYKELCTAAHNEEKRLTGLKKRQNYARGLPSDFKRRNTPSNISPRPNMRQHNYGQTLENTDRRCYVCGEVGHLASKCKQAKKESSRPQNSTPPISKARGQGLKAVTSVEKPLDLLYPDTDSEGSNSSISTIRVEDKGSRPHKVTVTVQGALAQGVIDSGADITIINADLFKNIAAATKLRRSL